MYQPPGYSGQEQTLARALNITAAVLFVLAILLLILPTFAPPFWVSNATAGLFLQMFLAWFSAGDVRRFRPLIAALIGGFVIGAVAQFAMLISGTAPAIPLILVGLACLAAALILFGLMRNARSAPATWLPWIPESPPTRAETFARIVFGLFGVASLGAAFYCMALPFASPGSALVVNPLILGVNTIKLGVLGLCALPIAFDVRRFTQHTQMITALIVGNAASFVVIVLLMLTGLNRFGVPTVAFGGWLVSDDMTMFLALLLDGGVIAGLLWLNNIVNRAILPQPKFLSPSEFRALEATAETLIAGEVAERVPPHEIVLRTDNYLASFNSSRLRLAKLAAVGLQLFPLIWLRPPVNYLHPKARQDFINARFKEEIITPNRMYRALDAVVHTVNVLIAGFQGRSAQEIGGALSFTGLVEAMLRFNMQLTYLGYYSNPAAWAKDAEGHGLGYVPFSERPKDFPVIPRRLHPPLAVTTPDILEGERIERITDADVVIIGSGAAGSILAEQMLKQGRRVLLLEKGRYIHPDDFTEDEVSMISQLYGDGALQISQALRFTVLQGSCVGGTTVVNNAVCFDTPDRVLDTWNGSGQVIDVARFRESQRQVRERLHIRPISAGTRQPLDGGVLNHGDSMVERGIKRHFHDGGYTYDVVSANIVDCLGCGYCNIGCKYGRKLSMLDEVLPSAQKQYGAENFVILSEAEATRLVESNGTITQIEVRVGAGRRKLVIDRPKTVIVSAGTVASSWLLMQSHIGARHKLPVGRGLSFNMGSPLHALFDQPVNAYDGVQIAHYLAVDAHPGFVYETWYNPPVAQALAMPGWLETHFQNMQNYDRMVAVGVLVGTESNARITRALVTGGPDIVFQPTAGDLNKLIDALVLLGDVLFAGGAQEIYASTRRYAAYRNGAAVLSAQSEVDRLRELVKRDEDILLGTGHPQGGNALGLSPKTSVVGADFKVHGYNNLYVCDASVFPTSTTVNPQLTVMGLAHYAAQVID